MPTLSTSGRGTTIRAIAGSAAVALVVAALAAPPASAATGLSWSGAEALSGSNGFAPHLAASDNGRRLTATWYAFDGSHYRVQASTSGNGGASWSPPANLSGAGQDAFVPQVAASDDGTRAAAVWRRWNGSHFVLQSRSSTNSASSWGATRDISSASQSAYAPRLAASNDAARLSAVWEGYDGSNSRVLASSSGNTGGSWSAPAALSQSTRAFAPRIASTADGNQATAVWFEEVRDRFIVRVSTTRNGGAGWSRNSQLSDSGVDGFSPEVAVSADGRSITVIWMSFDGQHYRLQSRTSTNGGSGWSRATDIVESSTRALSPQIAASSDGQTVLAAWERIVGGQYVVQVASSRDGGSTWSSPQDLSEAGGSGGEAQLVVSDDGGGSIAAWIATDGGRSRVQAASSSDSGATWTPAAAVSEPGAEVFEPTLAGSADTTRATALWSSLHGTSPRIEASNASVEAIPGPPGRPTGSPGDSLVQLEWDPPADDGDSPITGYRIQQRVAGSGAWESTVLNTGNTSTRRTVGSLLNGTRYEFRIAAINSSGIGTWSDPSAPVSPNGVVIPPPTLPPPTLPPPPDDKPVTPAPPNPTAPPDPTAPPVPPGGGNPALPAPPSNEPSASRPTVKAKAVSRKGKLKVRIRPKSDSRWRFTIQKKRAKKWKVLRKKGKVRTWKTRGTRSVNLPKGRYRVVVPEQAGYLKARSKQVRLRR